MSALAATQAGMVVDGQIATLMQQQLQAVTQLIQSQLQILGSAPASAELAQAADAIASCAAEDRGRRATRCCLTDERY